MSPRFRSRPVMLTLTGAAAAAIVVASCGRSASTATTGAASDAASKVYVAPGQYDEFYAFVSGGFSGNLPV
jgi:nitrous-oxide reductase